MKKVLLWAIIAITSLTFNPFSASAKDIPAGMRMEIAEDEDDDNEFVLFTYKDEDGTFGYYLGLGHEFNISEVFDITILGGSISHIDEVCLYLGETADDALASLNALLGMFDKDVNTCVELPARLTTGAEGLAGSTTVNCIVKKKFIGGKYLQFHFVSGKHTAKTDLGKSSLKFLKKGLELDMKRHKND
jgi:hypothetical protein